MAKSTYSNRKDETLTNPLDKELFELYNKLNTLFFFIHFVDSNMSKEY